MLPNARQIIGIGQKPSRTDCRRLQLPCRKLLRAVCNYTNSGNRRELTSKTEKTRRPNNPLAGIGTPHRNRWPVVSDLDVKVRLEAFPLKWIFGRFLSLPAVSLSCSMMRKVDPGCCRSR